MRWWQTSVSRRRRTLLYAFRAPGRRLDLTDLNKAEIINLARDELQRGDECRSSQGRCWGSPRDAVTPSSYGAVMAPGNDERSRVPLRTVAVVALVAASQAQLFFWWLSELTSVSPQTLMVAAAVLAVPVLLIAGR